MRASESRQKVQVWIYCLGSDGAPAFLLLRTRPKRGAFWQPITGHVEPGESFAQAAMREIEEESGLKLKTPPKSLDIGFSFEKAEVTFHEEVFFAQTSESQVRLDPTEHTDYRWAAPEEAISLLKFQSNVEMLRALLKKLEGK